MNSSPLIRRPTAAIATVCALLLVLAGTPAAGAAPATPATSARVSAYLSAHPGGQPLNDNEISYGDGALIVTLTAPTAALGTPDCPSGWFCFYEYPGYGYPRGKLSSCGVQELSTWDWEFRVESAHFMRPSGRVAFLYYGTTLFEIGAGNRTRADAYPYRNLATRVRHTC